MDAVGFDGMTMAVGANNHAFLIGKFGNALAASTARGANFIACAKNDDLANACATLGDHGGDGPRFGACAKRIGGIFHIHPRMDLIFIILYNRSNLKI